MTNYTKKQRRKEEVLSFIVRHCTDYMADRVANCGGYMTFLADKDLDKQKLVRANFCRHTFCPMCRWRRAKKDALKLDVMMRHLNTSNGYEYAMLTLTTPTVKPIDLKGEIMRYSASFVKLMHYADVSAVVKGYARKIEITYDGQELITPLMYLGDGHHHKSRAAYYDRLGLSIGDRNPNYDKYHPHYHVLLAFEKGYFDNNVKGYITRLRWLEMWRKAMRDDSITQVDIRRYKLGDTAEVATYAAKDSDLYHSQRVFDTLFRSLRAKQMITYGGAFSDAHKAYKAGKLDKLKYADNTDYAYWLLYKWQLRDYVRADQRELSPDERQKYNHQLIEEVDIDD